jgi:hypothetical protein
MDKSTHFASQDQLEEEVGEAVVVEGAEEEVVALQIQAVGPRQ